MAKVVLGLEGKKTLLSYKKGEGFVRRSVRFLRMLAIFTGMPFHVISVAMPLCYF